MLGNEAARLWRKRRKLLLPKMVRRYKVCHVDDVITQEDLEKIEQFIDDLIGPKQDDKEKEP